MNDKVLLLELKERTSASGNRYLSGWLGKASVVAFLDKDAIEPTWQVFVSTPKQRAEQGAQRWKTGPRTPMQGQNSRKSLAPEGSDCNR